MQFFLFEFCELYTYFSLHLDKNRDFVLKMYNTIIYLQVYRTTYATILQVYITFTYPS